MDFKIVQVGGSVKANKKNVKKRKENGQQIFQGQHSGSLLSHLHILCVCVECRTGRWGSKNKEKKDDQKTDEGWKKKIEEKEKKISQLTCD